LSRTFGPALREKNKDPSRFGGREHVQSFSSEKRNANHSEISVRAVHQHKKQLKKFLMKPDGEKNGERATFHPPRNRRGPRKSVTIWWWRTNDLGEMTWIRKGSYFLPPSKRPGRGKKKCIASAECPMLGSGTGVSGTKGEWQSFKHLRALNVPRRVGLRTKGKRELKYTQGLKGKKSGFNAGKDTHSFFQEGRGKERPNTANGRDQWQHRPCCAP